MSYTIVQSATNTFFNTEEGREKEVYVSKFPCRMPSKNHKRPNFVKFEPFSTFAKKLCLVFSRDIKSINEI